MPCLASFLRPGRWILLLLAGPAFAALVPAGGDLRIAAGFRVVPFASPKMAPDIRAMTIDGEGRVLVSGPGYLRYLLDEDRDGTAERVVDLIRPTRGATGMASFGTDLLLLAGEGLQHHGDPDGDGLPDPTSSLWLRLELGERGGQSVQWGPDGWVYVLGGHASHWEEHLAGLVGSPIARPQGGAAVRLSAAGGHTEILGDGFYDVRDMAFDARGELFTWENGRESWAPLPWHQPPALVLVEQGVHHGWHKAVPSGKVSRPLPAAILSHGLIRSLICYRHYQFPEPFRGGIWAADWAAGRLYHLDLQPRGSGYRADARPFLEAVRRAGWAPSAMSVAPDGSLLVASGGRQAMGGVLRIQYVAEPAYLHNATNWSLAALSDLDLVLNSPQPDAAWSRSVWMPVALRLGPAVLERVLTDPGQSVGRKLRALEVLVELFDGPDPDLARAALEQGAPEVRARLAWAMGRRPRPGDLGLLEVLCRDPSPQVRRHALAVMGDRAESLSPQALQHISALNLGVSDEWLRRATVRLLRMLPEPGWKQLWERRREMTWVARAMLLQAGQVRGLATPVWTAGLEEGMALLKGAPDPARQREVLQLMMASLGEWSMQGEGPAALRSLLSAPPPEMSRALRESLIQAVQPMLGSPEDAVRVAGARLLGFLRAETPGLSKRVADPLAEVASPEGIFELLMTLARLRDESILSVTDVVTEAVLALDPWPRDEGGVLRKRWMTLLIPVLERLLERDPALADAIVRHPEFGHGHHVGLIPLLGSGRYLTAAAKVYRKASEPAAYDWSPAAVDVIAGLREGQRLALLRRLWDRVALRDRIIVALSAEPAGPDRRLYLWGLGSDDPKVVRASLESLRHLPREEDARAWLPLVRLVRCLQRAGGPGELWEEALALFQRESGLTLPRGDLGRASRRALDWYGQRHPLLARQLDSPGSPAPSLWALKLKRVRWELGRAGRGAALFDELGCAACHDGTGELAGDLAGFAAGRGAEEVMEAIAYPDRDCPPSKRLTVIQTRDGVQHRGVVIHETAHLILLQTDLHETRRLWRREVAQRFRDRSSVMPSGLVNDLEPRDLADLHAHLKSLTGPGPDR